MEIGLGLSIARGFVEAYGDTPRAAAILYGDWGTSKAYVIGLAFAVGGYAPFWLIAIMCALTALVGINYIILCRLYPDGGGV